MTSIWFVFYVYGAQVFTIGNFETKARCDFVAAQLIKSLPAKKAFCVEVPQNTPGK